MTAATATATRQLVIFTLGDGEYALPIQQVQEVINYTEPAAVTSDDERVRGVINLRGNIIAVLDLAAALGHDESAAGKVVIADTGERTFGVIVDDVAEVLTAQLDQLSPVPVASATHISAVAQIDERLIMLLDAERLTAAH